MGQCASACRQLREEAHSDPEVARLPPVKAPLPPPLPLDEPASYVAPPSPVAVVAQAGGGLHHDPSHQWCVVMGRRGAGACWRP